MALTKATYYMIEDAPANVKDFGAVGDGVADDTAAIKAALASGASRVYVPQGTYMVSDYLRISTPMTFFGDGRGLSIIKTVNGYTPLYWLLNIYNTSNVTVQGLTLEGNKTNNASADYWLLEFGETSTVSNVTIRDVAMQNGPYLGAYVATGASNVLFDNCVFENNGTATGGNTHGAGIYIYFTNVMTFSNCKFVDNWEHGAYLDRGTNVNVIDCLFEGNGVTSGLNIGQGLSYRCSYGSVLGCIMRGNATEGFRISASAAPNLNSVTASNNLIYGNGSADREVFISYASNIVFTDNYIGEVDGTNTPARGLLLATDPTNIKVSDNFIIGYENSIFIGATSLSNIDISNNFIIGVDAADIYGIFFSAATTGDYVSVRNNYIKGFTWSMGISNASFAVNNLYVADNYCVGFSSGQFTYPGGGTLGTPVYIERYKTTITASVTGATVNAGTTNTATLAVAGYLGPTQINGSPPSALTDGQLWSVAPASAPNTTTVKLTNVTGAPITFATANWQFDVRSVIFD